MSSKLEIGGVVAAIAVLFALHACDRPNPVPPQPNPAPAANTVVAANPAPTNTVAPSNALTTSESSLPALLRDTHVTVHNTTGATIRYLLAGRAGSHEFRDWLGTTTLAPDASVDIDFDDGQGSCDMLVMATFDDGSTQSKSIDVCGESNLYFS